MAFRDNAFLKLKHLALYRRDSNMWYFNFKSLGAQKTQPIPGI